MVLRTKPITLPDLADLDGCGQPKMLPVGSIDEDPEQPRREFDDESLRELAETIKARGVRSPVSVRPHPSEPGRWILNFGARRLRASKFAGKAEIPAFVDEAIDSYDQVIENEQREGLKPLELALFIKRQLERGHSRTGIARGIGKSPSYVTLASALVDAPEWLMDAYRAGKCRGMFELCELRRLHEQDSTAVEAWLVDVESVGRVELRRLKEQMSGAVERPSRSGDRSGVAPHNRRMSTGEGRSAAEPEAETHDRIRPLADVKPPIGKRFEPFKSDGRNAAVGDAALCESLSVDAVHGGKKVRVVLGDLPIEPGTVYVVAHGEARVVAPMHALDRIELVRGTAT